MKYNKPAISINDQIGKLRARGLRVDNPEEAAVYLSNISYYRLRAYTYPYQDNAVADHPFIGEVSFGDIIALYTFDRKLRLLVFDAIEKIEIAFRTRIIYEWAMQYGSHWHTRPELFRNPIYFAKNFASLEKEIRRANETFLEHYQQKYDEPATPPAWMSLEVASLGLLSMMFKNLKRSKQKKEVARHFGLLDVELLENWMQSFTDIRNICAHHARLWNRRLSTRINLPRSPVHAFIVDHQTYRYKFYPALCAMVYLIRIINPTSTFQKQLMDHMGTCPKAQLKEMGFPDHWLNDNFWRN
ncbi:MAG: Abi family protein [Bacteroidota bacterium]